MPSTLCPSLRLAVYRGSVHRYRTTRPNHPWKRHPVHLGWPRSIHKFNVAETSRRSKGAARSESSRCHDQPRRHGSFQGHCPMCLRTGTNCTALSSCWSSLSCSATASTAPAAASGVSFPTAAFPIPAALASALLAPRTELQPSCCWGCAPSWVRL